ncbi:MAG: hypothetical protein AAF997_06275 [Myxococcota bacterium]
MHGAIGLLLLLLPLNVGGCPPDPACPDCTDDGNEFEGLRALRQSIFELELAYRWAPVHYQVVERSGEFSLNGRSDYLTAVDFDGDWNTLNNWSSLAAGDVDADLTIEYEHPANAAVYYSVVTTATHWYIVYAFYHPRDWCNGIACRQFGSDFGNDLHENDLEGFLAIVRRPPVFGDREFGSLQAIITVAHNDFYSFVPAGTPLTGGEEGLDGIVPTTDFRGREHPCTTQEAKGHGLYSLDVPGFAIQFFLPVLENGVDGGLFACEEAFGEQGDYVKYVPSGVAQDPDSRQGWPKRDVGYRLVPIVDTLWARRRNPETFRQPGQCRLRGNDGVDDLARAPWCWDDTGGFTTFTLPDGLPAGTLATDPAWTASNYFDGFFSLSRTYTHNPYQSISCERFPDGC